MRFFKGTRRACTIRLFGLADCCRNDGLLEGLAGCSASERELAGERHDGNTHYLGKRCAKKTFFCVCIRREKVWCTFGSKLGRILQEQGRSQLGVGWSDCRGLTVAEIERIDFGRLDLSEFTESLMDGSMDPGHLAARRRRHRGGHARAHPRLLQPGRVMARAANCAIAAVATLLVSTSVAGAVEWRSWCGAAGEGPSLGWHFYCDRPEEPAPAEPAPAPAAPDTSSATERIGEMRRALEDARATAILEPTTENVAAYLRLQSQTLQRAAVFSDVFRRTVWATPELDYTLKRPVGALAKRLWSDERRAARDAALASLSERYGLIYLGHTGCAGCRVFGPLLRAFSSRHGLDVLAVSLTGGPLEGWPEAVPDNGRAEKLGLAGTPVPAVVLFDTKTRRVLPVGFGVMAEDQLAERIFTLTALEPGHDY